MKNFRIIGLLAIMMLAFGISAFAQVNVTATGGTTNATYTTLGGAFTAINAGTHTGAITVDITASFTETANTSAVLNSGDAAPASYTSVLIRPSVDGVTITGTGGTGTACGGKGLIELNGADNVTIDGDNPNSGGTNRNLTLTDTCVGTYASVIRVALSAAAGFNDTANNNTFRNLIINGSAPGRNIAAATSTTGTENTTFGILVGSGASATSTTTAPAAVTTTAPTVGSPATATNLIVDNNTVTATARAVFVAGSAATVATGLQVTNNIIGNATTGGTTQVYSYGIGVSGSSNAVVTANTVYVESFIVTGIRAIDIGTASTATTGATVNRNRVNRTQNNSTAGYGAYGINLGGGTGHTLRNNFVSGVINNAVGTFSTTFGAFGIRVGVGSGHFIYHNSVNMYGNLPSTGAALTAAIAFVPTAPITTDVRNNIFANSQTESAAAAAASSAFVSVFLPSTTLTSAYALTLNNNAYYQGAATNNGIGQAATTAGTGFYTAANFDPSTTAGTTNFRAYTSTLSAAGTNDNASFASSTPPPFTSNTDLHIPAGTATRLESGGAAVGVTIDIDNETRNATTPDIGADEFVGTAPLANDISVTAIIVPSANATFPTGGTVTPQASFTNLGTATQTNVMVQFTITGPGGFNYNDTQTIASIAPNQTVTVTFAATPALTMPGSYVTTVTIVTADGNAANNSQTGSFTASAPVAAGTVSVGTGQTYTSLTNAGGLFSQINSLGTTGSITINITSDLTGETGAFALNELAGGATVTIQPSGAARTITGSAAAGLVSFNGTDGVTINGSMTSGGTTRDLTITNTGAGGGIVFSSGTNGAQNNVIRNVNVIGGSATGTVIGIAIGGNTFGSAGADNDNNQIVNNNIQSSIYGIYVVGASALNKNTGTVISGNSMTGTGTSRIGRIGMFIGFDDGAQITRNTISGISSAESADAIAIGVGAQGIGTTAPAPVEVSNAVISRNYIGTVVQTNTYSAAGIVVAGSTTGTNRVDNNMVTGVLGNSNAGDIVAGIFIGTAAGGTQSLYFNSVSMTGDRGPTTGQYGSFALAIAGTDQAVNVIDNALVNTQTVGVAAGTARSYAMGISYTTFANLNSNYNDLYVTGTASSVGITGALLNTTTGAADRAALTDLQTATGKDTNSISANPVFNSTTDLHVSAGSPLVDAGTPVPVTFDFDGQTRGLSFSAAPEGAGTVDIGADEIGVPTAATAVISGRVRIGRGNGIRNVTVKITGGNLLQPIITTTGENGRYQFQGLPSGQTYVVEVSARRYVFTEPTRVVGLNEDLSGLDFIGEAVGFKNGNGMFDQ